ncbi:MAG: dethiobiotin synthase [Pseudomonadota bacterium]
MKTVFITGTDTGVGKTWAGLQLLREWRRRGYRVAARKPLESGCPEGEYRGRHQRLPADALAYAELSGESLESVCRYRLEAALSPLRAAQLEGRRITLEEAVTACEAGAADRRLVEGAGGFYSPLVEDGVNADLAVALAAPVLLVVEDRLGCLNQTLLSLEAIERRGLPLAGVVFNAIETSPEHALGMVNVEELRHYGQWPVWHSDDPGWEVRLVDSMDRPVGGPEPNSNG